MIGLSRAMTAEALAPPQGAHLLGESFADPFDGGVAGFDEQLAVAVTANAEAQEIAPQGQGRNAGLVFVEDQPSGRQPRAEARFDLFGLVLAVTQGQKI